MKDVISPARLVFASSYFARTDERLTNMEQTVFSSQWETPEDTNARAIQGIVEAVSKLISLNRKKTEEYSTSNLPVRSPARSSISRALKHLYEKNLVAKCKPVYHICWRKADEF